MISFGPAARAGARLAALAWLTIVMAALAPLASSQHLNPNDLYLVIDGEEEAGARAGPVYEPEYHGYGYVQQAPGLRRPHDVGPFAEAEDEARNSDELIGALADQLAAARRLQQRDDLDQATPDDANSHWPATGLEGVVALAGGDRPDLMGEISAPVNDPDEFEARRGELTDELNRSMPNTLLRQELLMSLMNGSGLEPGAASRGLDLPDAVRALARGLQRAANDAHEALAKSELANDELAGAALSGSGSPIESEGESENENENENEKEIENENQNDLGQVESSTRYVGSEYIDRPLALSGHQYVQGGAGEGRQLLGPEGTFENVQVVKTDSAIPSYCDPPNPCPLGYTAKDGCLEDFVNLASFSREYQAKQKCSCDNEHSLFNCASPLSSGDKQAQSQSQRPASLESRDVPESSDQADESQQLERDKSDKLDTLARTIQNRFGDLASVQRLISKQQDQGLQQQRPLVEFGGPLETLGLTGHDDENSDYLVRSARKLSSLDMHHKVNLD